MKKEIRLLKSTQQEPLQIFRAYLHIKKHLRQQKVTERKETFRFALQLSEDSFLKAQDLILSLFGY